MSHLDEGTLHALLDGELDLAEVGEIQKHLGSCVTCGSRLQEVKQVLAEADQLVGAMEVPSVAPRSRPEPPRAAQPSPPPSPSRFQPSQEPGAWDEPPVLLVPDPVDPGAARRRWMRGLALAATLAGVVFGGRLIGGALQPSHPVLPERDLTAVSPAPPSPPVLSREESQKPSSTLATRENKQTRTQRPPVAAAAPKSAPVPDEVTADTQAAADASAAQDSALLDSLALEAEAASDSVNQTAVAIGGAADSSASGAGQQSTSEADAATRRAAALALAELDRERRRQRANAATAALPPPARPEVAQVEPEPPPRPPTLEQRSQVYLRIGLDEAVKQLGGPVHVIEGMTPEFIGLTRTQLIPGSATNRPVVRVVYLDARGRLILLDQQRADGAQAPTSASGSLRWTIGDVMLYLRGEPSPDVLRGLQARVR